MTESDYYQHYVETFQLQRSYLAKRNRLTIAIMVMVFLVTLTFGDTESAEKLMTELQKEHIGAVAFSYGIVNAIINCVFLWVVMNYFQINLTIERMYTYIHRLEDFLSNTDFKIDRESDNYLDRYPLMSYVTHRIYVLLFPILIIIVSFVKLLSEVNGNNTLSWLNCIILALTMVITVFYISNRWFDESAFSKKINPDWTFSERVEHYFKQESK